MTETVHTISDWAAETFGPPSSDIRVAARANEELAELLRAVTSGAPVGKVVEECADVLIVLARLSVRIGLRLDIGDRPTITADVTPLQATIVAMREMHRLVDAIERDPVPLRARAALTAIWQIVGAIIVMFGSSPAEAVNAKMAVNRRRVWNLTGDGHGYHLRDKVKADAARSTSIPTELTAALDAIATERGSTPGEVLRDAIAQMKAARHG